MSTQTPLTPLDGLIGKEFLYDENILISNYNPFDSRNTLEFSGLYNETTLTGKLYIFNKKEYKEPTPDEFKNIKNINELTGAEYRLIPEATFNYLSISILSKYNENTKERTFQLLKEDSALDINPSISNDSSIDDFGTFGTFAVFVIDYSVETGKLNKKDYMDLDVDEQFLMYLIPNNFLKVTEGGIDSTKLISLTLLDASKQNISTSISEVIPSQIPEEVNLNYFYVESSLVVPGDTNCTRTSTFDSIDIYFKVSSDNDFNFETDGFSISETLKQSIFNNLKASLLNDTKFSTLDISVLSLDKLIFSLINNEVFVSLTLSNSENNIIIPETPSLNLKLRNTFNYTEETVNETLSIILINFKGAYLLPLVYYTLGYNDSNGASGLEEPFQLAQNNRDGIYFSTGDKDLDLPNRRVYLYGGASNTSTLSNQNLTNTLLRSNIQNDGSLEGFTQIDTNSLNLYQAGTYTYINDPINGTGWVYIFGGLPNTGITASNKVMRAPILTDGTIGGWENVLTLPENFRLQKIIGNPEDKSYFYAYSSLRTVSSTNYNNYLNIIYTYKINEDGSLILIQTYTSTKDHYINPSIILKDPVTNKQYLYIFGTEHLKNDPSIYRYEISGVNEDLNLSYNIIGSAIKVGNLDKPIISSHLIEDRENVYIVGGLSISATYKTGARRTVLKYPKDTLLKGSPTNLINPEMLPNISNPISHYGGIIATKYGYYIIGPITTTDETGTVYNWQSTNRVLGFKYNKKDLELTISKFSLVEFGNYQEDAIITENKIDQKTNFFPNKFGYRLKEELYTNLFVKQNQVLEAYGETIKFVTPGELTEPITLEEIIKPVALPKNANIFLKWIEELCSTTFLDKYNDYRFVMGNYDTNKDFSLVIPELIFNILYTRDLYELNKEIFKSYLLTNAPSLEIDPEIIITEDYIDTILYCFYNCRVGSESYTSNKNILTFGANGLSLPDVSNIIYSSKLVDYEFIFFPQRHKRNEQSGKNKLNDLSSIPQLQNYFEKDNNLSSCKIDSKVPEEEINKYPNMDYVNSFNYFVAPNGNDSNNGKTIYTPKATVNSCPAGSRILLLPGRYTQSQWYWTSYDTSITIAGCGDSTILETKVGQVMLAVNKTANGSHIYKNLKMEFNDWFILLGIGITHNYYNRYTLFQNVNFYCNNQNYLLFTQHKNYSTGGACIFDNCVFHDLGELLSTPYNTYYIKQTEMHINTEEAIAAQIVMDSFQYVDTNVLITNLKDNYTFKPMYTLLPLNKGQNENKSINLDYINNITNIKNLNYKI